MFVRRMALCAVILLPLAGCARTVQHYAANEAAIAPHADDAAAPTSLHPPGDDGLLPYDPIAKTPPMPVAVLEVIKRLGEPDHGGAVAFLQPTVTTVKYEKIDLGPAPSLNQPYLLDSGDKVRVFVYGQPNLSHVYPIDGAGYIVRRRTSST